MDAKKLYITPDALRVDSYALGAQVLKSGFSPQFMVALWRGGAPVGCFVHELLKWRGVETDHIAIRTSRYTGIDQAHEGAPVVHSTSYLRERLRPGATVLLVDDVWDSGVTIVAFFEKLAKTLAFPLTELDIRVATVYYKPTRNRTSLVPAYFVHKTDAWLVFPHELEGMGLAEIEEVMGPKVAQILRELDA